MNIQKIKIHFAIHMASRQSWQESISPGTVYLNAPGLLTELEKRLGLGGQFPPQRERLGRFQQNLEKYASLANNAFFTNSLRKDPVATAELLLGWRDELIFSGWKTGESYQSPRLRDMAEVEKAFVSTDMAHYGEADRWKDVEVKLGQVEVQNLGIGEILIYDNPVLFHPCIQNILKMLEPLTKSIEIKGQATDSNSNLFKIQQGLDSGHFQGELNLTDNSFALLRFTDNMIAAEFMAAHIQNGWNPVIVGNERSILDDCLNARSCPATGSELESANTGIIQLFKLLPVARIAPLNIYNLMAFLQSPASPLHGSLRFRLSKVLSEKPGVLNSHWNKAIADFKTKEAQAIATRLESRGEKREVIDRCIHDFHKEQDFKIQQYLDFSETHSTGVNLEKMLEMLADVRKWIMGNVALNQKEEEKNQFLCLSEMCAALALQLKMKIDAGDSEMKNEDFLKLLHSIYEPADFINFPKQIQSTHAINHSGAAVVPADVFVWTDFYNGISSGAQRFLSEAEELEITAKGGSIYSARNFMQLGFEACKRSILLSKKRCILFMCETHNGEPVTEHPLFARIKAAYEQADKLIVNYSSNIDALSLTGINCPVTAINSVDLPLPPEEFLQIEPNLIHPRKRESASSLEKLIEFPFDWTVQYAAEFRSGSAFAIPDMLLLKGNISHAAMEEILTAGQQIQPYSESDIHEILDRKILEGGAALLLPENRFEYESFKRDFTRSALSLIEIIKLNNLTVVGCEKPLREQNEPPLEIEDIGQVSGFMDLLLSKPDKNFVVFDLKWAYNVAKYQKKIAEGSSIQLALYARAMGDNTQTAYFILSSNTLISRYTFNPGTAVYLQTGINNQYSEENTMRRTLASYKFRMQQLKNGELEMGEGAKLQDLQYGNAAITVDMIPIADKNGDKKKNYYSGLELFKGGIV